MLVTGMTGALARGADLAVAVAVAGEARLIFGARPRRNFVTGSDDCGTAGAEVVGFATGMNGVGVETVVPDDPAVGEEDRATGMTGAGVETLMVFAAGVVLAKGFAGWGAAVEAAISFAAGVLTEGIDVMTGAAGAAFGVIGAVAWAARAAGLATGSTGGRAAPGDDMPAVACFSFSTDEAMFLETPVGGTNGAAAFAGAMADGLAAGAGFAGLALFATGGAGAGLPLAGDVFGTGAEIFLADFLTEDFFAIRAGI